jgi:hypothetical protein
MVDDKACLMIVWGFASDRTNAEKNKRNQIGNSRREGYVHYKYIEKI